MATLLVMKQDVLEILNTRDEVLAPLPIPMTTTVLGLSTTLRDATLGRGTGQPNRFDARQVEIVELVASGPAVGEAAGVDDAGFDGTDQLTVSPAFTNPVQNGTDYLLFAPPLSKEKIEAAINELLRDTFGPHVFLPSLVDDSSLDAADLSAWTTLGTPSTVPELITTGANVLLGERSIHAVADAADEGFESNVIDVHENEAFLLSVFVRAAVGSVRVSLRNVTAGDDITPGPITIDEPAWTEVRFTGTIPVGCEQVQLRIDSIANLDDFYMGAHAVLQMTSGRSYTVPTWLTNETQVLDWVFVPRGIQSEDTNSFVALGEPLKHQDEAQILREERGVHPFRINLKPLNKTDPVAMIVQRSFDALSSNTTNSQIDRQYASSRAAAILLRNFQDAGFKFWARAAAERAEQAGYGVKTIQINATPTVAL